MTRKIVLSNEDRSATGQFLLLVDVMMMFLIIINLLFIVFDWLFTFAFFQHFVRNITPAFFNYYDTVVHPDFLLYDLWFVTVYVIEIAVRWMIATYRHTYSRWFLYPFIHWYDVLGCIPVGTFRWLRLLRLFSISLRLHKMGIIDLRKNYFYERGYELYQIFIEEITDHVFVVLLDSVKREVINDAPVTNSLLSDVIKPQQGALVKWIAHRIQEVTETNYGEYKDELKRRIDELVTSGLENSDKLKRLMRVPFVGKQVVHALEGTLSDVAFNLIESTVKSVYSKTNTTGLENAIDTAINSVIKSKKDEELDRIMKDIISRTIDRMKDSIETKSWQKEGWGT